LKKWCVRSGLRRGDGSSHHVEDCFRRRLGNIVVRTVLCAVRVTQSLLFHAYPSRMLSRVSPRNGRWVSEKVNRGSQIRGLVSRTEDCADHFAGASLYAPSVFVSALGVQEWKRGVRRPLFDVRTSLLSPNAWHIVVRTVLCAERAVHGFHFYVNLPRMLSSVSPRNGRWVSEQVNRGSLIRGMACRTGDCADHFAGACA